LFDPIPSSFVATFFDPFFVLEDQFLVIEWEKISSENEIANFSLDTHRA